MGGEGGIGWRRENWVEKEEWERRGTEGVGGNGVLEEKGEWGTGGEVANKGLGRSGNKGWGRSGNKGLGRSGNKGLGKSVNKGLDGEG